MSSALEHYRQAETLLGVAAEVELTTPAQMQSLLLGAIAHGLLGLTGVTALNDHAHDGGSGVNGGMPMADYQAWREAAGEPNPVKEADPAPEAGGATDVMFRLADAKNHAERGDAVEAWIKDQRDRWKDHTRQWFAMDVALDAYRLHADLGVPLDQPTPGEVVDQ